jgi:aryl-alcohol dehydrogenase-like predicted oxidoreductase
LERLHRRVLDPRPPGPARHGDLHAQRLLSVRSCTAAADIGALAGLRHDGKVAAIGPSNVTITQLQEARTVASITSVQNGLA